MEKYTAKQIVVQAVLYDGANFMELVKFTDLQIQKMGSKDDCLFLEVGYRRLYAYTGDYVIKKEDGSCFFLTAKEFHQNYQKSEM